MLSFRFALGTAPGKWLERYSSYTQWQVKYQVSPDPLGDVLSGDCLLGLVRLPDSRITDDLHTVYLYEEEPGVAVPHDSVFAQLGEQSIQINDLAGEPVNYRISESGEVDIPRVKEALQIVAANVGVCIAPRPLLKVLSKKKVTALGLEDPNYPVTQVALVWKKQQDSEIIQDFIGIAKGRTPSSGRYSSHSSSSQENKKTSPSRKAKGTQNTKNTHVRAVRGTSCGTSSRGHKEARPSQSQATRPRKRGRRRRGER